MSQGKLRVGIVFGGRSTEHEVSILSARNILAALDRSRFEPVLIGIDKSGRWLVQDPARLLASARDPRLVQIETGEAANLLAPGFAPDAPASPLDVVFPVLHGTLGEDGAVQGLLEVAGIPYVGAGILGSAIGMDKDVTKRLLREAGIAVADFRTLRRGAFEADPQGAMRDLAALGFPVFIKPANAGSSVGIRKVSGSEELAAAIRHAFDFDSKVIVEAAVTARELELAVLGGEPPTVSVAGEIVVRHPDGFYSYDAKYLDPEGARLDVPAEVAPALMAAAQALARRVFAVLECEGMARVDLFLTAEGRLLVNEINTIPGFTAISMYPRLWAHSGVSSAELVTRLIELALRRARERGALQRSVTT